MKTLLRLTAVSVVLSAGLALAEDAPVNPNVDEAKNVIKTFSMQLKGELKHALETGGPLKTIDVCKERAPAVAAEVGAKTGWKIGRTSLKPRNPELNTPDAWEQGVLAEFAKRQAAGEEVQTITYGATVETAAGNTFRFMQAIPTAEICLACHGTQIAPAVAKALDENYPQDQARGYSEGELRGAFSVSKPL